MFVSLTIRSVNNSPAFPVPGQAVWLHGRRSAIAIHVPGGGDRGKSRPNQRRPVRGVDRAPEAPLRESDPAGGPGRTVGGRVHRPLQNGGGWFTKAGESHKTHGEPAIGACLSPRFSPA